MRKGDAMVSTKLQAISRIRVTLHRALHLSWLIIGSAEVTDRLIDDILQSPISIPMLKIRRSQDISNIWVFETGAECLRSIYPSLGMRQLFGDVTMGKWRHN